MGSNRETRIHQKFIHLFLAFDRSGTNKHHRCIRKVIKDNEEETLRMFEAQLLATNRTWRIHKTVNPRCPIKAMKHLMKKLIDHPELCDNIDCEWRSSLLKPECIYGKKKFMFDIDTKDIDKIDKFNSILKSYEISYEQRIETPKGFHYTTNTFDTREIIKECGDYITKLNDGYVYIKTVSK